MFTFYVLLSCLLLASGRRYQQSVILTSANRVSSGVFGMVSGVKGYFGLRSVNESLQASNAQLENELLNLRNENAALRALINDSIDYKGMERGRFDYVTASVLNNSVRHPRNFFTIDRGREDGIETGMGVVDQNGIVGIVQETGTRTSRVISLLNVDQHFSVKFKGTEYVGSLSWRGSDPNIAYIDEVPRHVKYRTGDTIVTSGNSTTFPEGLPVGTVMSRVRSSDDNFFVIKIRLAPEFPRLTTVRVIKDALKNELDSLGRTASNE